MADANSADVIEYCMKTRLRKTPSMKPILRILLAGRKVVPGEIRSYHRKPSIDLIIAMACYFHVSTDYLLMGKDHDKVDSRTKLLDVVTQLTEIAKSL